MASASGEREGELLSSKAATLELLLAVFEQKAVEQSVHLEDALADAHELRAHLETRVAERTADLVKNIELARAEITRRISAEVERERFVGELKEALANVKTLQGLLPICAWCKRIRDDKGYWMQVETYIGRHSAAQFTHGMCPECARKLEEADDESTGT
jgi:hypothetical protein